MLILHFNLYRSPEDAFEFESIDSSGSLESRCSYFKMRLRPNTKYVVFVQAINSYGEGPLSKQQIVTTLQDGMCHAKSFEYGRKSYKSFEAKLSVQFGATFIKYS